MVTAETFTNELGTFTRRKRTQPQQTGECIHRGELVGREPCTCGSSSKVKVHRCRLHRLCCPDSNADRIKGWEHATLPTNCGGCADFFPKPTELQPLGEIEAKQQRETERHGIEAEVTVMMTAFRRPGCVGRQVASIKRFYPNIRILIGDSGDRQPEVPDGDATIIPLPFDCGLSAARNALVDLVETPYLLLVDDDYIWRGDTSIESLMRIMQHSGAKIVGMSWTDELDGNGEHRWTLNLERRGRELIGTHVIGPELQTPEGDVYYRGETTHNAALVQTEAMREHRWNELLKVQEHWDYYLRLKEQHPDWLVVHAPNVVVTHDRNSERLPDYREGRNRPDYERLARQLHGLDAVRLPRWREMYRDHAEKKAEEVDRPSVLLIGTGHCGSSVAAKMLHKAGWNLPSDADQYNESTHLRNYLISGDHVGFCQAANRLKGPVVVKDPKIAPVITGHAQRLADAGWFLLWLQRDMDDVKESYKARGEDETQADRQWKACEQVYREWNGQKLAVTFEQLQAVAECWKVDRIGARLQGAG